MADKEPVSQTVVRVRIVGVDMSIEEMIKLAFKVMIAVATVNVGFAIIGLVIFMVYKALNVQPVMP